MPALRVAAGQAAYVLNVAAQHAAAQNSE